MMAWVRYCLRFADQGDFQAAMPVSWQAPSSPVHETLVIGTIYRVDTKTDGLVLSAFLAALGALLTATISLGNGTTKVISRSSGFHVNLAVNGLSLPSGLTARAVNPSSPKYVWL